MAKSLSAKDTLHNVQKRIGKNTVIELPVDFNWQVYLELNPDVRKQGFINEKLACEHYDKWGKNEGRQYKSPIFNSPPNQPNRNVKYVDNVIINQDQTRPQSDVTFSATRITEKDLTVIIPNKDGQSPAVTINSLYNQTFKNFDIIIINDFDGNANTARNKGFKNVKTKYVLFSDNDIEWEPTALQDMYDCLEKNPTISIAYGSYDIGGKSDTNIKWNSSKLLERNYISTMSMVRTEDHPGFDESVERLQDWDVWLTMLENGKKGIYIEKKVFSTKIREGITKGNPLTYQKAREIVRAKHKPKNKILAHINLNSKEEIPEIEFNDSKLKCVILGGHIDKSPFQNPLKMVEELYGNNEEYNDTIVVFGYNRGTLFDDFKEQYPNKKIIIYQFEQVYNNLSQWYNIYSNDPKVIKRTAHLRDWFSKVDEIWEYDINNLIFLKSEGFENIKHMPLKYANSLKRLNNDVIKDIDVLFYGEMNERRKKIIDNLNLKYRVEIVPYGTFNEELYNYIDRSRIILNLHYYSGAIQEQVRLFDLIINDKCVISEPSKTNYFNDLIVECEVYELSEKIRYLLKNNNWMEYNNVGEKFEKLDNIDSLIFDTTPTKKHKKQKVLVVMVNYGHKQLNYLHQVIDGFNGFNPDRFDIDIYVHSNIAIDRDDVTTIIHEKPPQNGWNWLPWECRKTIYDNRNKYDLFLYSENDHLYNEHNLSSFLDVSKELPNNYVPGFIQYESHPQHHLGKFYPAYHATYDWDYVSVETFGEYTVAQFTNEHHAGFLLTKEQLKIVLDKWGKKFLVDEKRGLYMFGLPGYDSPKVRCCADVYSQSGLKKVIPISHFNNFLIYHLPNKYYDVFKNYSFDNNIMTPALNKLLKR